MNPKLRNNFLAATIAAMIASTTWAAENTPGYQDTMPQTQPGQSMENRPPVGSESGHMSPDAARSENPLYSRTPDDLKNDEVVDLNGEKVGTVKEVVAGHDRASAHAVISSGGFLGLGDSEIVVPLDELQPAGEKLQISETKDNLESRQEYTPEGYIELDPDRPISEFSAFEPVPGEPASATEPEIWQ
jgi:sporulation protein YlmC with PRC-barrel domain